LLRRGDLPRRTGFAESATRLRHAGSAGACFHHNVNVRIAFERRALIMEKMPYRSELDMTPAVASVVEQPAIGNVISSDWREGLPVLTGAQVVLRELRSSDATSLFALLTTEEVSRFISPPPTSVEGFERFIVWANRQRQ